MNLFKRHINESTHNVAQEWQHLDQPNNDLTHFENITSRIFSLDVIKSDMIIGKDVMNDLEMILPYNIQSDEFTVLNILSASVQSFGGKLLCKQLLLNPVSNIDILNNRVRCLKEIDTQLTEQTHLDTMTNPGYEHDLLWFFEIKDDTIHTLLDTVFINMYGLSNTLNQSETCLTSYNLYRILVSPSIGVLSPLIYVVIPYLIIQYKLKNFIKMSFVTYLKLLYKSIVKSKHMFEIINSNTSSLLHKISILSYVMSFVFYFQGLFNTFALSNTTYKVAKYLSQKVIHAVKQLQYYMQRVELFHEITQRYQGYFFINSIADDTSLEETKRNLKQFDSSRSFTIFSNFGKYLKFYKNFQTAQITALLNQFYFVDYLIGIVDVKHKRQLCYVNLISDEHNRPDVSMKQTWHISFDHKTAVANDLSSSNIVLTGPNAGGKSTIIKTFSINVLLAQSIGVNSSMETTLRPFFFVNTQINIPDCKGKESLFEAEMNRCMFTLETLKTIGNKPSLIVMDEIFNSTNMIEAVSGAFSILTELSNNIHCMVFITTHFLYLTRLSKSSNFINKKMNVQINSDTNQLHYPYLLKNGISRQYIALELLKNKGFDQNIIKNAMNIKASLFNIPNSKYSRKM